MIIFNNKNKSEPYRLLFNFYNHALSANQKNIEAIQVSSFNKNTNEINSRLVNLKIVDNEDFIFFSNYNSTKASEFNSHNQVAVSFFWSNINIQIRIKAKIRKTSKNFNKTYFKSRMLEKNALAISSYQSRVIESYNAVQEKYKDALINKDLKSCPDYWGGYSFTPYYFEFWEGHESRLNKREAYEKSDDSWKHLILQP